MLKHKNFVGKNWQITLQEVRLLIKKLSKQVALIKDKGMWYYVHVHLIICIQFRYSLKPPSDSEVVKYVESF